MTFGGASARPSAYTVGAGHRYALDEDLLVPLPVVADNSGENRGLDLAAYVEPDRADGVEIERLLRRWGAAWA